MLSLKLKSESVLKILCTCFFTSLFIIANSILFWKIGVRRAAGDPVISGLQPGQRLPRRVDRRCEAPTAFQPRDGHALVARDSAAHTAH